MAGEIFSTQGIIDKIAGSSLDPEDRLAVQAVLLELLNDCVDTDYNVYKPQIRDDLDIHYTDATTIEITIRNFAEVSQRRIWAVYKEYPRVRSISLSSPATANQSVVMIVLMNRECAGDAEKDRHVPCADNSINNMVGGLKWSREDVANAKAIMKTVVDMDADMRTPEWSIIDRPDSRSYILIATPIERTAASFYDYLLAKFPGVVSNTVFRTEANTPTRAPRPRLQIFCNRVGKPARFDRDDDSGAVGEDAGDNGDNNNDNHSSTRPTKRRKTDYYD